MQERRTTIRLPHRCRAQYCSSEDLLPRDGQITNLSERGAGLLVREAHRNGELLSVGFSLPGAREPLTATGVVRWAEAPRNRHWYPIGVDWLQLEEAARNRLREFLAGTTQRPRSPAASRERRTLVMVGASAALLAGLVVLLRLWSLSTENRRLQATVEQRGQAIGQLEQEGARLALELGAANTQLSETSGEVDQLNRQAQGLGEQLGRLTTEVDQVKASYLAVSEERERLMQRVLEIEQERASLASRLSSIPELRL
jgi:outer membrane murein-binding lipoprotein Lpp